MTTPERGGRRRAAIRFGRHPARLAVRRKTDTTGWDASCAISQDLVSGAFAGRAPPDTRTTPGRPCRLNAAKCHVCCRRSAVWSKGDQRRGLRPRAVPLFQRHRLAAAGRVPAANVSRRRTLTADPAQVERQRSGGSAHRPRKWSSLGPAHCRGLRHRQHRAVAAVVPAAVGPPARGVQEDRSGCRRARHSHVQATRRRMGPCPRRAGQ